MSKYFSKIKYEVNVVGKESFAEWQEKNPQYKDVTYQTFLKYWKHLRTEIFDSILENPAGVDLPFYLGNLSIRVIDVEFKGVNDFLKSNLTDKETGEMVRVPFSQSEMPKKIKITWSKHKLFRSLASLFGMETSVTMKRTISKGVRLKGTHYFQKAFDHEGVPSKYGNIEEKSLFDLA